MSLSYLEHCKLGKIEENTAQTVALLRLMNLKMDKQIKLLERIVSALERQTDDGR